MKTEESEKRRIMLRRVLLKDNIKEQIVISLLDDQDIFFILDQLINEYRKS